MEHAGIVPNEIVLELYGKMLCVYYVEERLKVFDRLGKVSFHASARGHEKLQIGMTLLLKPRHDWFFYILRWERNPHWLGYASEGCFPRDAQPAGRLKF